MIPSVPGLPVEQRRQIVLGSHSQPLRYAPWRHLAFQPQTQADYCRPQGSRLLPGLGFPPSLGNLSGPFRFALEGFDPSPFGLRVHPTGSSVSLWGTAPPSMPGLIPRWQDVEAPRRCARLDRYGDSPVTTFAIGRRIGPHHNQPPRQVDL